MASAHKYQWPRADGTTGRGWRAKWVDNEGRQQSKRGFDRRSDALAYAEDREAEARHNTSLGLAILNSRTTFADWSATWLDAQHVRRNTTAHYENVLKRALPTFGRHPLTSLRPHEFKVWRGQLEDRYADRTVDATWQVVSMILKAAVDEGLLPRNPMPAGHRTRPREVEDHGRLLTWEQIDAWATAMPLASREMPLVAATTGLRQGELLGLRLPNVDFLRRELRVVEQLLTPGAGHPVFAPLKTRTSTRTLPLADVTLQALARHLERFPPVQGEPIFRSARGGRWRRQTFGDMYRDAKVKAGLPDWVHWHALRDVFASTLVRERIDAQTLVALMGHSSILQAGPYLKMWGDGLDTVRQALERRHAAEGQERATETNTAGQWA